MTTDYVMFIHGTNTRDKAYAPTYADPLFESIKTEVLSQNSSLHLKTAPLYWGNVGNNAEKMLQRTYSKSDKWSHFWFRHARNTLVLRFIGDAALYLSRYTGAEVIIELKKQIMSHLGNHQLGDRLHLVTHSLGQVILFDLLFSSRWDLPPQVPIAPQDKDCDSGKTPTDQVLCAQQNVMEIRTMFYGLEPKPQEGIRLVSVHTMSSPLTLFSLIDVDPTENNWSKVTHDITPKLQQFLHNLVRENHQRRLPWKNFAHPGDFLAYPLNPMLPEMVDPERQSIHVEDIITELSFLDMLIWPFRSTTLAMIDSVTAHTGYWQSRRVAKGIADSICSSNH
jgi:hypothetical protein